LNDREERERRYQTAVNGYEAGDLTATQALIVAGIASRAVRLAYLFPRLFGHLSPLAAADRWRPVYAPAEGWRTVGSPGATVLPSESRRPDRGGGPGLRPSRGDDSPLA
jgi:hypothetical protein